MKTLFSIFFIFISLVSHCQIIYLNGTSSAGKSTLTAALQDALPEPYLRFSIDQLMDCMPRKTNNWHGTGSAPGFFIQKSLGPDGNPLTQVCTGPFGKKINQTLKDIVLLFASQNYNLIIEDVSCETIPFHEWKCALKDYDVLYVGITTPLEIIEQREKQRGDRELGTARTQYMRVHQGATYDLEIDTYHQTTGENVKRILQALER